MPSRQNTADLQEINVILQQVINNNNSKSNNQIINDQQIRAIVQQMGNLTLEQRMVLQNQIVNQLLLYNQSTINTTTNSNFNNSTNTNTNITNNINQHQLGLLQQTITWYVLIFSLLICWGVAIYQLWCGGYYWDYNCNYPLQTWLVVSGCFGIVVPVFNIFKEFIESQTTYKSRHTVFKCLTVVITIFSIVWIIIGSVWVWNSNDDNLCNYTVWKTTQVFMIGSYIAWGFIGFLATCMLCVKCISK